MKTYEKCPSNVISPTLTYSVNYQNPDEKLQGSLSLPYGFARKLAFVERLSTRQNLRILFGEAGRRSVPWGCLWYEINGSIYQFGAHLANYPEAIGPNGKDINERGLNMLAEGLNGVISINDLDFKWVQNELNMAPIINSEMVEAIQREIQATINGLVGSKVYQSRMRAKLAGIPVNAASYNCTSYIGQQIGGRLGIDLPEYMPIELFEKLQNLCRQRIKGCLGGVDCQLQQVLNLTESQLLEAFNRLGIPEESLKTLTKPTDGVPAGISWGNLTDALGVSGCNE